MERRNVLRLFLASSAGAVISPNFVFGKIPFQQNIDFSQLDFGPDFKWGVATSAFQIELQLSSLKVSGVLFVKFLLLRLLLDVFYNLLLI